MTEQSPKMAKTKREGVPMWMPLVGLMAAFLAALLVGATVCPTLSAIVLPPGPKLPSGTVTERSQVAMTKGDDEWLYGTDQGGCAVALFYQDWLHDCTYAPNVTCKNGVAETIIGESDQSYHVVTCQGKQAIGNYTFAWTVYVDSGYPTGDKTIFRLVREVSN
jgi:hypothetical protein